VLSSYVSGTTDSAVFGDFIEQLLQYCRPFLEPNSVLVMDNASFHHMNRSNRCVLKQALSYYTDAVFARHKPG
jgi:hypothetical protein